MDLIVKTGGASSFQDFKDVRSDVCKYTQKLKIIAEVNYSVNWELFNHIKRVVLTQPIED